MHICNYKHMNLNITFFIAIFLLNIYAYGQPYELRSRIKTEQKYFTPNIPSNNIYSIDVKRVQSSQASEVSRCWSVPRNIQVDRTQQLFRLQKGKKHTNRQQKVYEKLTSLSQQQNIIEEFAIIGDKVFVMTSDDTGYFISISNPENVITVQTNFYDKKNDRQFQMMTLRPYMDKVLIISRDKIIMCSEDMPVCQLIKGYEAVPQFRGADVYEYNSSYFVFLIGHSGLVQYELIANKQLKNKKVYDKNFFGVEKVHLRDIVRVQQNSLYVLDGFQGVWELTSKQGFGKNFVAQKQLVFQQFGCYQIIEQDQGQSLILTCNPSHNNFFVMNLIKSKQFKEAKYEPLETVFMQDQLYQIQAVDNILMGRIYTGVKLFWSSKRIGNPYPYFYRKAGNIFLHNAIQSKLKVINKTKTIFMAAEDELLKYELKSMEPFVSCYSPIEVNQKYKITYHIECQETGFIGQQNICTKEETLHFETWEHKEVKVGTHILPFILSFVGVISLGYILQKIYKKYNKQVEDARRKYNIQEGQLSI